MTASESLIEKLEALYPQHEDNDRYREGIEDAIIAVRQHKAQQPQDAVERVAKAIENAMFWNGTVMCTSAEDLAKAAIPAMQPGEIPPADDALLKQAWELSTWVACINWRGGENQKEWLDDLRTLIEAFQTNYQAFKANTPKRESGERCKVCGADESDQKRVREMLRAAQATVKGQVDKEREAESLQGLGDFFMRNPS
jgi:hypothetical protein